MCLNARRRRYAAVAMAVVEAQDLEACAMGDKKSSSNNIVEVSEPCRAEPGELDWSQLGGAVQVQSS